MSHTYDTTKRLNDMAKEHAISLFSVRVAEAFPGLMETVPSEVLSINDEVGKIDCRDIGIDQNVIHLAVKNLATFLLSQDVQRIASVPLTHARRLGDEQTVTYLQHLAKWVKDIDIRSVVNVTHLAYYEAQARYQRQIDLLPLVLPGERACAIILQLATALTQALGVPESFTYRLDNHTAFNSVVSKGEIDFLVGDTLYLTQTGKPSLHEQYALLVSYVLLKASPKYKDTVIRRLCMVNPAENTCLYINVNDIGDTVLSTIFDCIYGPAMVVNTETDIPRKRHVTLVMGLVTLMEAESVSEALKTWCQSYQTNPDFDDTLTKQVFNIAANHFSQPVPQGDASRDFYQTGLNLLNRLLVVMECTRKGEEVLPNLRLSDEIAENILNKALR